MIEFFFSVRARLLNTQSRKTQRQARERQLEEGRRLATLQKRRELRAAGIELQSYSRETEIPFEKSPTAGFYPTTNEFFNLKNIDFTCSRIECVQSKRKSNDLSVDHSSEPAEKHSKSNLSSS